jgi:hypothetical protein
VKPGHKPGEVDAKKNRDQQQAQHGGQAQQGSDVGKDTDNDGRAVKPGHKAGDVDGKNQQRR